MLPESIFILQLLDVLHLKYNIDFSYNSDIIRLFQEEQKGWSENENLRC